MRFVLKNEYDCYCYNNIVFILMIFINYLIYLKRFLNFVFELLKKKNLEEDIIDCFYVKSNVNYYKLIFNGLLE